MILFDLIVLRQSSIAASVKATKKAPAETEKGVPLAPSAKDLNPWYSTDRDKVEEVENEKT